MFQKVEFLVIFKGHNKSEFTALQPLTKPNNVFYYIFYYQSTYTSSIKNLQLFMKLYVIFLDKIFMTALFLPDKYYHKNSENKTVVNSSRFIVL